MAPLVTVLLLTYRHENFIAEAIRGVLSQTYRPLEIIILDDASPDATPEAIAAELGRHPERSDVRVIRNPRNLGFRDNTVRGLADTHGEFVVRLGGDDIAAPELVERMVEVWRAEDVSLITVNVTYIDADSKPLNRLYRDPAGPHDASFETLAQDGVNVACFGAAIGFEHALYLEFGWSPEYLQASDIMMPFYGYLAKGVRFIPQPLVQYRFHSSNLSLSLAFERSTTPIDKLMAEEHIQYIHLAHGLFMEEELARLNRLNPERYGAIAERIGPLLAIHKAERARKLVAARIKLHELGVKRFAAPSLPPDG
jgi:glycosyltransferase involved in cell wall biosynthesis